MIRAADPQSVKLALRPGVDREEVAKAIGRLVGKRVAERILAERGTTVDHPKRGGMA